MRSRWDDDGGGGGDEGDDGDVDEVEACYGKYNDKFEVKPINQIWKIFRWITLEIEVSIYLLHRDEKS